MPCRPGAQAATYAGRRKGICACTVPPEVHTCSHARGTASIAARLSLEAVKCTTSIAVFRISQFLFIWTKEQPIPIGLKRQRQRTSLVSFDKRVDFVHEYKYVPGVVHMFTRVMHIGYISGIISSINNSPHYAKTLLIPGTQNKSTSCSTPLPTEAPPPTAPQRTQPPTHPLAPPPAGSTTSIPRSPPELQQQQISPPSLQPTLGPASSYCNDATTPPPPRGLALLRVRAPPRSRRQGLLLPGTREP